MNISVTAVATDSAVTAVATDSAVTAVATDCCDSGGKCH